MNTYNSFVEKRRYFIHVAIHDINTLNTQIDKFKPKTITKRISIDKTTYTDYSTTIHFFFRGVSNASYKIYSSMQRCCFERNKKGQNISMLDLSNEVLTRFNNSPILIDALNNEIPQPSNKSDLAKWAFIQHFGGPSHLVDFTPDFESALFFAIPKDNTYDNDNSNLNNYISIYAYQDNPYKNGNLNMMYESSSIRGRELYIESTKQYPDIIIDTAVVDYQMINQPLNSNVFWGTSIYGEYIFKVVLPGNGNVNNMCLKNSHISRQKGNFFVSNIEKIIPLELAPALQNKKWNERGETYYAPYGYCLDIHKSLIPDINSAFQIPAKEAIYTPEDYIPEAKSELQSLWFPEKLK